MKIQFTVKHNAEIFCKVGKQITPPLA